VNLTIFDQGVQASKQVIPIDASSIYKSFEQVKDGRKKKGIRYPLPLLFTLLLLGKMAGETSIDGIVDWIRERKQDLKSLLNWPKDFPVGKTYTDALAKCDHHEVVKAITQVILKARAVEQCQDEPSRLLAQKIPGEENLIHTAVDGKMLRGTHKHAALHQPPVHLLSFYEAESGLLLDQFLVKKSQNEQSACTAILSPLLSKGRIITVDALFTSRKWCATVKRYGGYYMIAIKENTPAVLQDLSDFFGYSGTERKEFQYHKEVNKAHGRLETREIWTSTQMNEWFYKDWAGISQVYMIRRKRKSRKKEEEEIAYGITNLPRKNADAERLLYLNRKHWSIENRLHYRKDVTLGEDSSQVRSLGVPAVLAALNGGLLALMDFMRVTNVAKQMRHFCAKPRDALQWLLSKLSR